MTLSAALHATVGTLRRRPVELMAVYAIGAAVPSIARVPVFLGVVAALGFLALTGQLDALVADLASRELRPPDPEAEAQAFTVWVQDLQPALEPLTHPAIVGLLVAAVLIGILVALVVSAAASAGQIGACYECLQDRRGTTAALAAVRRHWLTFLGAFLLEAFIWIGLTIPAVAAIAIGSAVTPLLGVVVGVFAALVWLPLVVATRAVFAFVPVAVVVEDIGLLGSIRSSAAFIRREPVMAAGYYAIAVGGLLTISTVTAVFAIVDAGNAIGPIALFVVAPALGLLKTGLFAQARGEFSPPDGPVLPYRAQMTAAVRLGLARVRAFVFEAPWLQLVSAGLLVAGFLSGWFGAAPFVGAIEVSIVDRLGDHLAPAATLNFLGNNLTVSVSMAFSGVALAVPAAVTVWFNGLLLGVLGRLEASPAALAAFVTPHGLFELPALVVSGAVGLRLGLVGWRSWRGRANRVDLADALEDALWVLVGVAVLLAIASVIEGFVSPYYWRPFL